jgi:hypothetical protein
MTRVAAAVLLVGAAAAAAAVLNLLLLGRASGGTDRIGRLQPRATIPATPAPRGTIRPAATTTTEHHDGSDD